MEKFTETDDDRTVVLNVVVVVATAAAAGHSFLRFVSAHVVDDGAQFQNFPTNVRLGFSSSQIGFAPRDGPDEITVKNSVIILLHFFFFFLN